MKRKEGKDDLEKMKINKKYSVEQLIKYGHWMISYPAILFCIIIWLVFYYLFRNSELSIFSIGLLFFTPMLPAILYEGIMINIWRIWAFRVTDDVIELERRALEDKIIYSQSSIFKHIEIWTKKSRKEWEYISERFSQTTTKHIEDYLPEGFSVYYDKKNLIYALIFMTLILFMILSLIILLITSKIVIALNFCLLFYFILYMLPTYKKIKNKEAQIIINAEGMITNQTPFYSWDQIFEERARYNWRHSEFYLYFNCPQGHIKIRLRDLKVSSQELNFMMKVYRSRFDLKLK